MEPDQGGGCPTVSMLTSRGSPGVQQDRQLARGITVREALHRMDSGSTLMHMGLLHGVRNLHRSQHAAAQGGRGVHPGPAV